MADSGDTISAIATAPGKSGVGIVRLSGPRSRSIAQTIARISPVPRHAHYCAFRDAQGRLIDRGILLYFKSPESYTGEDTVEFQAHGGQIVLGLLLKETLALGARIAKPGEFTERAFLNHKIDLVQAEAVSDLINSVSAQAARSAARSLEGVFSDKIYSLVDELISIRVFVEGSLDFPDEEIDFLAQSNLKDRLKRTIDHLDELLEQSGASRLLREGMRVVIAGQPNVGKSSLLNKLTGVDRVIVTDVAGTTRDVIEDSVMIDGVFITLVDTAGIRESIDLIEQEGIRRSYHEIDTADLVILVSESAEAEDSSILTSRNIPVTRAIVLHNKIDMYDRKPGLVVTRGETHIYASAKTGAGIEILLEQLKSRAGTDDEGEGVILARERHIRALEAAKQHLLQGTKVYGEMDAVEFLAEELRNAQQCLGEITGEFHTEDLLGEIFSRFCIGK